MDREVINNKINMGQRPIGPRKNLKVEYEEIKQAYGKKIKQAKEKQEQELFIAKRLDMTEYKIKVERGSLDLEIIFGYVKRLQKMK